MAHRLRTRIDLRELDLDPHPMLKRLRETEPVAWIPVLDGWLVTSYELAVAVMRDPDTFTVEDARFSTAQLVGPSMLSLDGAAHAAHRQPFVAPFRPPAVRERFAAVVEAETDALIDTFAAAGQVDLRKAFAGPLAATVMTRALGLGRAAVGQVLGWYDAIVAAVTDITAGKPGSNAGAQAFAALQARLQNRLDAPDASSLLSAAAAESPLGGAELISDAAVLLFGGIETTEGMILNAVLTLLQHPTELARARESTERLDAALEESLRLEPAAAVIDRYATTDIELAGAQIAQGDLVRVSIAGANRDPAVFADPDRFDLARPLPRRHLAFAHGPHVCVGVHLARLEARTALRRLIHRLPGITLDPKHPARVRGLVFRKPRALHVRWAQPPRRRNDTCH